MRIRRLALIFFYIILLTGKSYAEKVSDLQGGNNSNSSPFGGSGGTDDFNPPPDPIDTPIDAGIVFLLIIGTAFGVPQLRVEKKGYMKIA